LDKVSTVPEGHDIVVCIHRTPFVDILAFANLNIGPLEAKILAALLKGVVWENSMQECIEEVVKPSIPFPVQELSLENVMPSEDEIRNLSKRT
jgi:hypothetical protein